MARIIVVDDSEDICRLLKRALEKDGHSVTALPDTQELDEKLCKAADLILLDVMMPVISIIITGILGNIIADWLFQIFKIEEPIAKGLALGTAAHAIGTAKALELGEIEGAMSSLSIAVAGLLTVVVVPLMSGLI